VCGRFASAKHDVDLIADLDVDVVVDDPPPLSWNVAPTQDVRVVLERPAVESARRRQLRTLRWGLVPAWAPDPSVGSRMINARLETLTERPAFRTAIRRRRCLVPATGYFEWERRAGERGRVPQFLHRDGATLWFAGLYDAWRPREPDDVGSLVRSFTIVTTKAPDALGHIHDRSPVVLPPDLRDAWLDPAATDAEVAVALLRAAPPPELAVREVSPAVNNHRNNGPALVLPARR
jgi:putative SOS response-associated peptidase YedK